MCTKYDRLSLALHDAQNGDTIYLENDIKVGFMAKLPDGVGNVTIDGQNHKITRDTFVNPNTILMDLEMGDNEAVMSILMNPGISLMSLEDGAGGDVVPKEHYNGDILQIGENDELTMKNVTGDGGFTDVEDGKWYSDSIALVAEMGWINGYEDGSFRPDNEISRAEVTAIVNRMLGRKADLSFMRWHMDELRGFSDLKEDYWAYGDIVEATNAHNFVRDGKGESWLRIEKAE